MPKAETNVWAYTKSTGRLHLILDIQVGTSESALCGSDPGRLTWYEPFSMDEKKKCGHCKNRNKT